MSEDLRDLRAKRADIENQAAGANKRGNLSRTIAVAAAALGIGAGGVYVYSMLNGPEIVDKGIPTSDAAEFPDDRNVGDNLEVPDLPSPITIERPVVRTEVDSATLARLEELEKELAQAREAAKAREDETARERELREELERERERYKEQIASLRSSAQNDQDRAQAAQLALEKRLKDLEEQQQRQSAEWERKTLELENDWRRKVEEARRVDPLEQERLRLEAEKQRKEELERERLAALRKEQAAKLEARVNSGMVAVSNTGAEDDGAQEPRALSDNESFVKRVVEDVPVARASKIANPHATVPQGSIIQASLETAIDSSLPGAIRAIVAEDVHSLDGSSVLIPAGSRVFGEYSSGIELGQKRVLVVWTRILTPSNRSLSIASYGADRLGRSGTSGAVDTRFMARFGGAAAISIIGAAPSVLAQNSTDDEDTIETIEDVGDDFSGATANALNDVLSIPPTIYVKQGASVSIIVDRDLEIF